MCYNGDMKKSGLTICVLFAVVLQFLGIKSVNAAELTDEQSTAIVSRCDTIKEDLKKVQKEDSRVRVYLGGYYETILTKFITPLNVRLVENNLSSAGLVENQNKFVEARTLFVNDFVSYQQALEELVNMSCKEEPGEFYDKLQLVQQKRKIMSQDVLKMRSLISEHVKLVNNLKGRL